MGKEQGLKSKEDKRIKEGLSVKFSTDFIYIITIYVTHLHRCLQAMISISSCALYLDFLGPF